MFRIFIVSIICLLISCCVQGQNIDSLLLEKDDTKAMYMVLNELEHKNDSEVDTFINQFVETCTKQEREWLKYQTVMRLYNASMPNKPTGELLAIMQSMGPLIGDKAPDFVLNDSTKLYDVLGWQTILFFYEHSCNLCHNELNELKSAYKALEEKNIRLVTIDCNTEQSTIQPWQYNITDSTGKIYHPYGVMKTPTYLVIDSRGIILQRCFTFEDVVNR